MWPLLKFLFGSASFLVWWECFVHWLPDMCSSRKQLWKTLRQVLGPLCLGRICVSPTARSLAL